MSQPSESSKTGTPERPDAQLNSATTPPADASPSSDTKNHKLMKFLFEAIRLVETGGSLDPENALGDGGKSLGPYQISKAYWLDAIQHDPTIGGSYHDVRYNEYAERIMVAYWDRYAPDHDLETLARIHNGGPRGHLKTSTEKYWRMCKQHIQTCELVGAWSEVGNIPPASGSNPQQPDAQTSPGVAARPFGQGLVGRK